MWHTEQTRTEKEKMNRPAVMIEIVLKTEICWNLKLQKEWKEFLNTKKNKNKQRTSRKPSDSNASAMKREWAVNWSEVIFVFVKQTTWWIHNLSKHYLVFGRCNFNQIIKLHSKAVWYLYGGNSIRLIDVHIHLKRDWIREDFWMTYRCTSSF